MPKILKITDTLTKIEPVETLLIHGKEIHRILFHVKGKLRAIAAVSDEGTAYYSFQHDKRVRPDTPVDYYMGGGLCLAIRIHNPADSKQRDPETDIEKLKDSAQANMSLTIGELHALYAQFPSDSPQAYAIAVQLRRQHQDKSLQLGEYDAVCFECRTALNADPRYAFRFGKAHCYECKGNVPFTLVKPLPREPQKPPPSLEDVQRRLKEKFGGA